MSYQPSEETGQSIMNMDTSEITINRIVGFVWDEEGTDVEDELPTAASSPTQIVVPAIPPAGTADPFGRGESFDLELAKVICDVSVLPSLVSPLQAVEVSSCANAADYAAPTVETVLESPGYTVPEELGCSWMPEFVPGSEVVSTDEGGYLAVVAGTASAAGRDTPYRADGGRDQPAIRAAEFVRDREIAGYEGVPCIGRVYSDRRRGTGPIQRRTF